VSALFVWIGEESRGVWVGSGKSEIRWCCAPDTKQASGLEPTRWLSGQIQVHEVPYPVLDAPAHGLGFSGCSSSLRALYLIGGRHCLIGGAEDGNHRPGSRWIMPIVPTWESRTPTRPGILNPFSIAFRRPPISFPDRSLWWLSRDMNTLLFNSRL
jgi:hypothetical protein